ncbi:MAG: septum formation initiator family protein [Lentisphaeria bacterium]|nr:septum formation initiator family protein [Lentisphaeria bacterium]
MRTRTALALLIGICVAVAACLWLGPVYRDNRATRVSLRRLEQSLEEQAREIERLNRELTKLRTDSRAIERVAREKFGLCREDEEIYHFEESAVPAAKAADAGGKGPAAAAGEGGG